MIYHVHSAAFLKYISWFGIDLDYDLDDLSLTPIYQKWEAEFLRFEETVTTKELERVGRNLCLKFYETMLMPLFDDASAVEMMRELEMGHKVPTFAYQIRQCANTVYKLALTYKSCIEKYGALVTTFVFRCNLSGYRSERELRPFKLGTLVHILVKPPSSFSLVPEVVRDRFYEFLDRHCAEVVKRRAQRLNASASTDATDSALAVSDVSDTRPPLAGLAPVQQQQQQQQPDGPVRAHDAAPRKHVWHGSRASSAAASARKPTKKAAASKRFEEGKQARIDAVRAHTEALKDAETARVQQIVERMAKVDIGRAIAHGS